MCNELYPLRARGLASRVSDLDPVVLVGSESVLLTRVGSGSNFSPEDRILVLVFLAVGFISGFS